MGSDKARDTALMAPSSQKAAIPGGQTNVISAGCRITGNLTISGSLRLGGEVDGDVHCDGALIVEAGARIRGRVSASEVTVLGTLTGEVVAAKRIEVGTGASVEGSIFAPSMRVEGNACVDGDLLIAPERSPAHTERAKDLTVLKRAPEEAPAHTGV